MRAIQPELQARLDSGAATLCRCWKLRRKDGVELGFTDHDGPVVFEGTEFQADTGMDASALQSATGLGVDNGQAAGALTSDAISEADIRAGLYDRGEIWHWLVDWKRPDLRVLLFRGELGEIRRADGAFEVELRGLTERLNVPVGRSILRACDRALGDAKCGVDVTRPEFAAEVEPAPGSDGNRVLVAGLGAYAPGWFTQGTLTWLDGENAGQAQTMKSDTAEDALRVLQLWQQPARPMASHSSRRGKVTCSEATSCCLAISIRP